MPLWVLIHLVPHLHPSGAASIDAPLATANTSTVDISIAKTPSLHISGHSLSLLNPNTAEMTIPTRWHKPSCGAPQVVVAGSVPECRACGGSASALLRTAAEEPAPSYAGIRLPEEKPLGQMNLWWPPSVPYTRSGGPAAQPATSTEDVAVPEPEAPESPLSEIYTSTLGTDHFRLLYLSGSRNLGDPIHGRLVEYRVDDCPEYETVSYTWGGEDGDATPCKPAYFGDFWDVLFLTRNCCSLLHYMRSSTVTRFVWVDAICINQDNLAERGSQVSLMPQIYGKCMRVVIYPGDHAVHRGEHRFRERIRIRPGEDADSTDPELWGPLLRSRYISRVWIIQELILSPSAVLAAEHHDVYLDNNILYGAANHHQYAEDPYIDGREWLRFMGQPWTMSETTLYEGLKMTFASLASDPRDKIFGILGILGANPTYAGILPEYSISVRDCVIGAMGLTLTVCREFWPLFYVQEASRSLHYPSWVPNIDEIASWGEDVQLSGYRDTGVRELGKWETIIALEKTLKDPRIQNETYIYDESSGIDYSSPDNFQLLVVGPEVPWYQDASIDSKTGALTLRLVRLFDRSHNIVDVSGQYGRFCVKGPTSAAYFTCPMTPPTLKQPCHMFLAFRTSRNPPPIGLDADMWVPHNAEIYLLFAEKDDASGALKLVKTCRLEDVKLFSKSPLIPSPSPLSSERFRYTKHRVMSLFQTLSEALEYKPREHEYEYMNEAMAFDIIIPGDQDPSPGLLQLALAIARPAEADTVTEAFRKAYTACLQPVPAEFNPVLDDECVWFTLHDNDALRRFWDVVIRNMPPSETREWHSWGYTFPDWFDLQIPGIGDTLCDEDGCGEAGTWCGRHRKGPRDYALHYWLPCAEEPVELEMPVRVRIALKEVVKAIRETTLYGLVRYLLLYGERVSETVEAMLERGPRAEDSNVSLHEWPKSLVDELGFVWRNEMVTFV